MKINNKYIDDIMKKYPQLTIEKYNFNYEGQNNDILIINDDLVFRFPKHPKGIEKLKRENRILQLLREYINLNIPNPEFVNLDCEEVGSVYSGYKIIKGISFKREIFNSLNNKNVVAMQLSSFLKELHNIPINAVSDIINEDIDVFKEWENLYSKIEVNLFPYMRKEAQKLVSKNFECFLKQKLNFTPTIIHGDFGPSNIIFDEDKGEISGVIDFNEVCIGDPANDVAALIGPFGYGEDFIRIFDKVYPNIDELIKRARFYASTFALQEALFGIENNDEKAFKAGIKQYI